MKKKIFLIEHLEPRLWKWSLFEYKNISKIVGKDRLCFTNIKNSKGLSELGKVIKKSVRELELENACVLDPEAKITLTPREAKKFNYFIFGGILGDYPSRKRTKKELSEFLPNVARRNIGKKQFPTDNAVYVVREICKGRKLNDMKFKKNFVLKINEIESVELPFCYVIVDGKPLVSEEVLGYLKRKRGF